MGRKLDKFLNVFRSDDAADSLGSDTAAKLAEAAATTGNSRLDQLDAILSAVKPEDVEESTVTVVSIVLDNSRSATKWQPLLGEMHDLFVNALKPALGEGIAIMVTCSTLEGNAVYPLTLLNDVPLFGKSMGRGEPTDDGLYYDHMAYQFVLTNQTPLRDRVKEQVLVLGAELTRWQNPEVARTVNTISVVITDGLDIGSETTPKDLFGLVEEFEDSGCFTEVAMFIGQLDDKFRQELLYNMILNAVSWSEISYLGRAETVEKYKHLLPAGYEELPTENLLRYWFGTQGLAADHDRLFLPGTDPKAIRQATGQMSQVAYQASLGAFKDGPQDELVGDGATVVHAE